MERPTPTPEPAVDGDRERWSSLEGHCRAIGAAIDSHPLASGGDETFALLAAGFAVCVERRPASLETFRRPVAGTLVEFRVAGEKLAAVLSGAFGPAAAFDERGEPSLRIDCWSEVETAVPCAGPPAHPRLGRYGVVTRSERGRFYGHERPKSRSWLDRTVNRIVACFPSAESLDMDERAKPFHRLLAVWLRDRGRVFVHGALVATRGIGILFAGPGGAGKSTSAVACVDRGFAFLGDDYVAIEHGAEGFLGTRLFATAMLDVTQATKFPRLASFLEWPRTASGEKAVALLSRLGPACLPSAAAIHAIALPRIGNARTGFRPAAKMAALRALAPSSLLAVPAVTSVDFESLAALVERLPCYHLDLGPDLAEIPPVVEQLVDEVGAGSPR